MSIERIKASVAQDLSLVDTLVKRQLQSPLPLINELGLHLIAGGGKRLRPLLVLLLARALNYRGEQHLLVAAMIELIHTATLLHDDVVDNSSVRRHRKTAKEIWGNDASVLVGDFLYSRAFQIIVEVGSLEVAGILADTTNTIAEGEVRQLLNRHQADIDEATFFEVIRCKTAVLFAAGTHISALLANSNAQTIASMREFGMSLGIGFQLVDDILDYAEGGRSGKEVGNDLNEGKPTLPLIYALQNCSEVERMTLEKTLTNKKNHSEEVATALNIVRKSGGLEYTLNKAKKYIDQAQSSLSGIPDSSYKHALNELMTFLLNRTH